MRYGAFFIPLAQTALLSLVLVHTSAVPISLMTNFRISERPRGTLLEAHSVGALGNVDGILSGHHFVDGRMIPLLTTLLCGSHLVGPKLERKSSRDCGKEKTPLAL